MSLMAQSTNSRHGMTAEDSAKFQMVMPSVRKARLKEWADRTGRTMTDIVLAGIDKEFSALEEAHPVKRRGRPRR